MLEGFSDFKLPRDFDTKSGKLGLISIFCNKTSPRLCALSKAGVNKND